MALKDLGTIDIIMTAMDGRPHGIDLIIADNGVTTDEAERFDYLIRKAGSYVHYVMSEDFRAEYPDTPAYQRAD